MNAATTGGLEPVREWGVQHGEDCGVTSPGSVDAVSCESDAREMARGAERGGCLASVVSRVAGGEWLAAE